MQGFEAFWHFWGGMWCSTTLHTLTCSLGKFLPVQIKELYILLRNFLNVHFLSMSNLFLCSKSNSEQTITQQGSSNSIVLPRSSLKLSPRCLPTRNTRIPKLAHFQSGLHTQSEMCTLTSSTQSHNIPPGALRLKIKMSLPAIHVVCTFAVDCSGAFLSEPI